MRIEMTDGRIYDGESALDIVEAMHGESFFDDGDVDAYIERLAAQLPTAGARSEVVAGADTRARAARLLQEMMTAELCSAAG